MPCLKDTGNDAVAYASRRLGDSWQLVLGIAAGVRDRGLELPEISEPAAIDTYIDEHITVARAAVIAGQASNIVEEIAPAAVLADELNLGALTGILTGAGSSAGASIFGDLLGGLADDAEGSRHSRRDDEDSVSVASALQDRVRAQLYGKALAAGPEATPAELWETIVALVEPAEQH